MKKRILPVLLALCMVMSLLPVMAFAAHDNESCTRTDCACEGCTGTCTDAAPCEVCAASATCNPCDVTGCTKVKGHDGNHSAEAGCTKNDKCGVTTGHDADCPKFEACGVHGCTLEKGHTDPAKHNYTGCANDAAVAQGACPGEAGTHGTNCKDYTACDAGAAEGEGGCTLCDGHEGLHNSPNCTNDDQCSAAEHEEGCPNEDAATCGKGGCTLVKGHPGDHNNEKCLGYNDDGKCGVDAGEHIAGCSEYVCTCAGNHTQVAITYHGKTFAAFAAAGKTCTNKAGCPLCAAWNTYVTNTNKALSAEYSAWKAAYDKLSDEAKEDTSANPVPAAPTYLTNGCTCADCKPNPAMGAVVDAEGNEVDPADPTEPTTPKAEDFTDMEDWMAADVQTILDKGWLQGEGETFNGRGVTTGATIAAVLARMDGEEITGTTWAQDALAWAEGKDVFEGIELTGETMARKDLVLVIWRMADKPESDFELTFTDVDGLEGDHLTAMKWAAENGIVKGNGDDTVTPDGAVNRAALCAMLARYDGLEK